MRPAEDDFSRISDASAAFPERAFLVYWDGEAARLVHGGSLFKALLVQADAQGLQAWFADAFGHTVAKDRLICLDAEGLPADQCLLCVIRTLGEGAFLLEGIVVEHAVGEATLGRQAFAADTVAGKPAAFSSATASQRLEPDFKSLVNALPDMVWMIDHDENISFVNAAARRFIGIEAVGRQYGPADVEGFGILQDLMEADGAPHRSIASTNSEHALIDPATGAEVFLEIQRTPVRTTPDKAAGTIYVARDISRYRNLELELDARRSELNAHTHADMLTDLPNRRDFSEKAERKISSLQANGSQAALMMIDLDRFSAVNDSVGRSAGDLLLVEMGQRIRKVADAFGGYASRLSGDEFAVIVDGTEALSEVAEHLLGAIAVPFFSGSWVLSVTASIGIVIIPDQADAVETLLERADNATYEAKRAGQNTWRIFDESLAMQAQERFELETDIRNGLDQDQFTSHYQAKIDLKTGEIAGIEALMRWTHPARGNIPPAIFIPLAEETGLIVPLGEKILTDACHFARRWNDGRSRPVRVAVNLSPRQVMFDDFLPLLNACLSRTGCKPEWLELEMTENILLSDQRRIDELMQGLQMLGVRIALDDFGTGYSAIGYLTRYHIETLKIDRSFVHDITRKGKNAALAKAITAMANSLGMTTVAEGIETPEEVAFMRAIGCTQGQGYLWHRPMPEEALLHWAGALQANRGAQQ